MKLGNIEKQLFFKKGRLFSSMSSNPREMLEQFFIRSGKITEEDLFRALFRQDQTRELLGQILIAEGLLNETDLIELLRLKTEETIYDCFLWTDGEFAFEEERLPRNIPASISLDIPRVIMEGVRRKDEWQRIRKVFPSRLTTFVVNQAAVAAVVELADEDQKILQLAALGMNLAQISLEMHAVEFYAASRLFGHYQKGLIEVADAPEEIPMELQVKDLREKLDAGVACFNSERYSEALAAFEAALEIHPRNKDARLFVVKIERIIQDREAAMRIPREKIPILQCSPQDLAKMELDPQEGFVLSRINGQWDVLSILRICPMSELEVLLIFKRFVDDGLIKFP